MRNPFKPGAGHMPPYLAGRHQESENFAKLLDQDVILKNLVLTGLRGLGKTVLLETFKPMAIQAGWLWAGTDLSESTSISEDNLATRLLTDLSVAMIPFVQRREIPPVGFSQEVRTVPVHLSFPALRGMFDSIPGLTLDKLKGVLEFVWPFIEAPGKKGIIFAYDEAQNLSDHAKRDQYPLSLLLDLFQSLQKKGYRYMLAMVGLPTLFPKLVEARTFAERMFTVMTLRPLSESETTEAVRKPIDEAQDCPISFVDESVRQVWLTSRGYPYFVQYVCREVFDIWVQAVNSGAEPQIVPNEEITAKLDSDFFAGRWAKATDRQRELLGVIAELPNADSEFTVREIVESVSNKEAERPFSSSHVNQMLVSLAEAGLVYKNRYGKYSFAVPLLGDFIMRQKAQQEMRHSA
jgi:hypothetical protein